MTSQGSNSLVPGARDESERDFSPESSAQRAEDSQELHLLLKDRSLGEAQGPVEIPHVGLKITARLSNASAFVSRSVEMRCHHLCLQNETQQHGVEYKYLVCLLIPGNTDRGVEKKDVETTEKGRMLTKRKWSSSCHLDS